MDWSRKKLPRTRAQLEQFVKDHGLHPHGVANYKGRDIFLAYTDLEHDRKWEPGYEFGYYQVAWFVTAPNSMERFDVGRWAEFAAMHDMEEGWTQDAKFDARMQTLIQDAISWIDKSEQAGRYDASIH